MATSSFKFELLTSVRLKLSQERGEITCRMESTDTAPRYMVRYLDGTGCQKQEWFDEEAIVGE